MFFFVFFNQFLLFITLNAPFRQKLHQRADFFASHRSYCLFSTQYAVQFLLSPPNRQQEEEAAVVVEKFFSTPSCGCHHVPEGHRKAHPPCRFCNGGLSPYGSLSSYITARWKDFNIYCKKKKQLSTKHLVNLHVVFSGGRLKSKTIT